MRYAPLYSVGVAVAASVAAGGFTEPLGSYLPPAVSHAETQVEAAINPANSIPGSLQAALSGSCPNYEYTWSRDQALVFHTILTKYEKSSPGAERTKWENYLKDFAAHTHTIYDMNDNPLWHTKQGRDWSFADAKYEMNGTMYLESWCSPQTDGPALRAMVLMRFADFYNSIHSDTYVDDNIYSTDMGVGVKNAVKRDLEYLAVNWDITNCEPWEEVRGKHFYNRLMARRAFRMGVAFASARGDTDGAELYAQKARDVEGVLMGHWNDQLKTIMPTNNGARFDDIQTVLASLHSYSYMDDYFAPSGDFPMANLFYTIDKFDDYFNINALNWGGQPQLGVALGRYTGDVYNGGCEYPGNICPSPCLGQPWFLATNGAAEFLYQAVSDFVTKGEIKVTEYNVQLLNYFGGRKSIEGAALPVTFTSGSDEFKHIMSGLLHGADSFLRRTEYHTSNLYKLDEQFNGDSGMMMSAGDLTWSYASLVTAKEARDAISPEILIASYTPSTHVDIEVIVTAVPMNQPQMVITGDHPDLGSWNVCGGQKIKWRRNAHGQAEWSAFIRLPKNAGNVKYKAVIHGDECGQSVQWQGGSNRELDVSDTNPVEAVYNVW